MRVVFFGTSAFAVPLLERLVGGGMTVIGCVTQPDRRQGRGLRVTPSPIKEAAQRLHVPIRQPQRVGVRDVEDWRPDVGVVAAYGQLIPEELLRWPPHGLLGVHPSLLPKYRGAAPIAWAILNGERETGTTIFRLDRRLDAGEMLLQRSMPIEPGEDAQALGERLAALSAQLLLEALQALSRGRATFHPQDESRASLAPKLTKAQGTIDWSAPAETIDRLVRATVPWPGATTTWQKQPLRVWRALMPVPPVPGTGVPGTVVAVRPSGVIVATGRGCLELQELQPSGRRRMSAQEFLAGHRVDVGQQFGER